MQSRWYQIWILGDYETQLTNALMLDPIRSTISHLCAPCGARCTARCGAATFGMAVYACRRRASRKATRYTRKSWTFMITKCWCFHPISQCHMTHSWPWVRELSSVGARHSSFHSRGMRPELSPASHEAPLDTEIINSRCRSRWRCIQLRGAPALARCVGARRPGGARCALSCLALHARRLETPGEKRCSSGLLHMPSAVLFFLSVRISLISQSKIYQSKYSFLHFDCKE